MVEKVLTRRLTYRAVETGNHYAGPGKFDLTEEEAESASERDFWQDPDSVEDDPLRHEDAEAAAEGEDPDPDAEDSSSTAEADDSESEQESDGSETFDADEYRRVRTEGRNGNDGYEAAVELIESGEVDQHLDQIEQIEQERDSQSQSVFDAIQQRRSG